MLLALLLFLLSAASLVPPSGATAACSAEEGEGRCQYSVRCRVHAGSASLPSCDDSSYFVLFIITDSQVELLTSQFFGATNFDTRVSGIKAYNNVWTNIEPDSLKYYTNSRNIDFSNNKIRIVKDFVFKNYMQLESLNISNNLIESLSPKTFFITNDSRKPALQSLDLSFNKIKELQEDYFKYLPKLRTLNLGSNKIVTLTDLVFRNCASLEILNLNHNHLTAINVSFLGLSKLQRLDLSYNFLKKIYSYELNRLVSITSINVSNNFIETLESNCFDQSFLLNWLDLSNNKIASPIDSLMFIRNNDLTYLNLSNNSVSTIQENSFKFNKLQYFNINGNILSGTIKENTFIGLTNVTSMNLFAQNISGLDRYVFAPMTKLLTLNISSNKISDIHNTSFTNTTSLKTLDLSKNNISSLGFLRNGLINLTFIDLSSNNLRTVLSYAFVNQTSLSKLNLSGNHIFSIQMNALPLMNLQTLDLSGNKLTGVVTKNMFSPAEYLRNLDLSNFNITRIEDEAFTGLRLLAQLNLSHNAIDYIGPNNFNGMQNVYNIDLSHNKLTNLKLNNTTLNNLKALYLNNNKLNSFVDPFKNISQLMYLDLSDNMISDLKQLRFSELLKLKVLLLSNNALQEFNSPEIDSLPLVQLDLASNIISRINITCFADIVTLNMRNNSLGQVNSSSLVNPHLQSLDLSGNALTKIGPGTFRFTTMLKLLNISHNRLSELRYGSLRGLQRAEVIDLSYNKLSALDVDIFHECTEMSKLLIDNNTISSFEVERLIGMAPKLVAVSLGRNPMPCREIVRNLKTTDKYVPFGRQIKVTSVDKVFHEDNVNGIKCGDTNKTETAQSGSASAVIIWCSVLSVVLFVALVLGFIYFRKMNMYAPTTASRVHLRAHSFSGSEFCN